MNPLEIHNRNYTSTYKTFEKTNILNISSKDKIEINYCVNSKNDHKWTEILHCECHGLMSVVDLKEYKVLRCGWCFARFEIPKKINTIEELVQHFQEEEEIIINRSEILDI